MTAKAITQEITITPAHGDMWKVSRIERWSMSGEELQRLQSQGQVVDPRCQRLYPIYGADEMPLMGCSKDEAHDEAQKYIEMMADQGVTVKIVAFDRGVRCL